MKSEEYHKFMKIAVEEAKSSLKEGNKGFGAVLVKNGEVVAVAHDTEVADSDPTAHAEMNVIKKALKVNVKDLAGCVIFSTHEPCPMCTGAIIWAKISEIVFGASIKDSLAFGRNMIDLGCGELIERSPWKVKLKEGVLKKECSALYNREVGKLGEKLVATNHRTRTVT